MRPCLQVGQRLNYHGTSGVIRSLVYAEGAIEGAVLQLDVPRRGSKPTMYVDLRHVKLAWVDK